MCLAVPIFTFFASPAFTYLPLVSMKLNSVILQAWELFHFGGRGVGSGLFCVFRQSGRVGGHGNARKEKTSVSVVSKSYECTSTEFGML